MKFTKLLPNSCNFRDLIDNNRVYVDKTALICQIAKDEKAHISFHVQDALVSQLLSIPSMNSLLMEQRGLKV